MKVCIRDVLPYGYKLFVHLIERPNPTSHNSCYGERAKKLEKDLLCHLGKSLQVWFRNPRINWYRILDLYHVREPNLLQQRFEPRGAGDTLPLLSGTYSSLSAHCPWEAPR